MKAGNIPWKAVEAEEIGECGIYVDMYDGSLTLSLWGMRYSSSRFRGENGGWRPEVVQKLQYEYSKGRSQTVWIDGLGGAHIFKCGQNAQAGYGRHDCYELRREGEGLVIEDALGGKLHFDKTGLIQKARLSDGRSVEYTYVNGALTSVVYGTMRLVLAYDGMRLVALASDKLLFLEYIADDLSQIYCGNGDRYVFEYEKRLPVRVRTATQCLNINYDADRRVRRIVRTDDSGTAKVEIKYNYGNKISMARDFSSGTRWEYAFNKSGMCVQMRDAGGRLWRHSAHEKSDISALLGI